ncbi:sodium-dependent organic anion transporter isoform X1 [Prionailurus viverrinus]|uniref:sodium-dependent organic anion transporter isoform X1 n=1 Tax=Prionailurus viverrinus TaxID=61388 RepID=UPI001FF175B7|nr:sodium-dependent organic anion transporter isoform X1 [Prionailurus viverrinus]XP_047712917.1 sodium-dependent organic anion transporter isoform X1 [Prionailurus viverrinus]XP_047712918.1 sodium-dependent organic anion transporter isoform X1 [Prionailurus viverrinus]XP_047712919.1 sodium-dependent organic anion transporter isoform X1 [Prionailurus viverrinus]XP_047712920.1 sodium-dependent organic anion transporter isoform X2 [Prionailurus viverrinus]XP_047712921.1 sodium-dependent organic 
MRANCSSSSACPANSSEEELPVGLEVHGNLELVFTVVTAVMMGLLMFSLGCSVEFRKLWSHIRRPWGIAVGLLCQFGLMPLTAYLLAISFSLKPAQAVAVLVMGCCPGGTISNIFTFWVDGDMDLSITMTTCSTVAALGMMPLCLYLYTLSWNLEQNLTIPYQNIGITLVCLTIPVAFGIYVNYRWPKQSKIILKIGAIVGGVLLLVVAVAGVVLAKGSWNSDITLLTISFIFPLIGHVTGFLLALLTHQSWQRCRTISLETGAQNIQMCVTMLQLSFTAKQLVQMLSFPLAYGLFQLLDGFLIVAAYKMYKRRLKNEHRKKNTRCEEGCHNKRSTSPKETGAFLEVNEEVAITSGPSMPMDLHTTLEPTGHISSGT